MSLSLHDGRPVVRGVLPITQPAQSFEFTARPTARPGSRSTATSRRRSRCRRTSRPTICASSRHTFRSVQSLGGGAVARTALLAENVAALRAGKEPREDEPDRGARRDPGRRAARPAFVAMASTMPSEPDIAREIGREIDPERRLQCAAAAAGHARIKARTRAARDLPGACRTTGRSAQCRGRGPPALKNAALDLLGRDRRRLRHHARDAPVSPTRHRH